MTGHVRRRGTRSWEIKFDLGTDPLTGRRLTRYHSVKGTKRTGGFWRHHGVRQCPGRRRRLQLQHLPCPGGVVAVGGMPQAKVADLVEAARQHVLEEAAHKLFAAEPAGAPAAGPAVAVFEGDAGVLEADDAGVGDGDAEDVAGEVVEHRLLAAAPGGDVGDPVLVPHHVSDDQVRATSLQQGAELAAHQAGERLDRQQEGAARRVPSGAVLGNAAAADQAMDVRVLVELLIPGMHHREVRRRCRRRSADRGRAR